MAPTLFFITGIIILVVLLILILSKSGLFISSGVYGERCVEKCLKSLPEEEYIVLNDLYLKNGVRTTQIDHIVVSIYGIFVIETKSYKGWIYGDFNKDYWTQNIWGNKYSLYNPYFQNEGHIRFLISKFKEIREKQLSIFPIEVFVRSSKLDIRNNDGSVIAIRNLTDYIIGFNQRKLTTQECLNIVAVITENNIIDKEERQCHKQSVKQTVTKYNDQINNGLCPRCGGHLVLRNGKYGNFYGCSNFPRCRFTR